MGFAVVFVRKLKKIILQRDVEKHSGYLLHGDNRNKILNDIVQEADSAKRNVRHGDTHIESRAQSIYIKKEKFCN